eukprot:Clim_evm28s202 gene=Clim_evmTU28s202
MADVEDQKPLLDTMDIVLLILLGIGGAAYYYYSQPAKPKVSILGPGAKKLNGTNGTRSSAMFDDSDFVEQMKRDKKDMVIFFGSQTGTAEDFARRLAKEAAGLGFKCLVADIEDYEMENLTKLGGELGEDHLAVFCMATYGEGDPTDNSQTFWDWMHDEADVGETDMSKLKFAVFSLGNKTYEHYQSVGRYTDKRLEELGAQRMCERGEGDDDGSIEDDFVAWKEQFWPTIAEKYGREINFDGIGEERTYEVVKSEVAEKYVYTGEPARVGSYRTQRGPYDQKNPFLAPMAVKKDLFTVGGERHCYHIEFNLKGSGIRYAAGDHLGVYPTNDLELVKKIVERLGDDIDTVMKFKPIDPAAGAKGPFPNPCTYRTALMHYADITTPLKGHHFNELAKYCTVEEEQNAMKELGTKDGKAKLDKFLQHGQGDLLDVLERFPSLQPPIDHVLEMLPRMQIRYYSISSSPKVDPNIVAITAVLVEYNLPSGRNKKGVATGWFHNLNCDGQEVKVPCFVRKSTFRLPGKKNTPVIMIGPGTGLAPFRGFIQDREADVKTAGGDTSDLNMDLYYGCRKSAEDYLYRDYLEESDKNGILTNLYTAFSREGPKKVYVQHLLEKQAARVWELLEQGGHVYICGDASNMARDVHNVLIKAIKDGGNMTDNEAHEYIQKLEKQHRYQKDVWS